MHNHDVKFENIQILFLRDVAYTIYTRLTYQVVLLNFKMVGTSQHQAIFEALPIVRFNQTIDLWKDYLILYSNTCLTRIIKYLHVQISVLAYLM